MNRVIAITMPRKSPPTAVSAIAKLVEDVTAMSLVFGLLRSLGQVS